jgi:hypothetical protein
MDDDYSNECTHNNNDKRCCKCIHCCFPIGCLLIIKRKEKTMDIDTTKIKPITLNELIFRLQQLQQAGYGMKRVTANMEYKVWGASFDNNNDAVDFDCYL